jgi:hypothetical protein
MRVGKREGVVYVCCWRGGGEGKGVIALVLRCNARC